jgi:hypothetical protein
MTIRGERERERERERYVRRDTIEKVGEIIEQSKNGNDLFSILSQ